MVAPLFSSAFKHPFFTSGGGIRWLLKDEFTTDRAAGSVDGTPAEPTGGNRVVTDTASKLSISGGRLLITGNNSWGNPGLWFSIRTRSKGLVFICKMTLTSPWDNNAIGWDTNQTSSLGADGVYISAPNIRTYGNGSQGAALCVATTDGVYLFASILRASGQYVFIKGGAFTNWTLLWIDVTNSSASVYPYVSTYASFISTDFIRVPEETWLPTPLAFDSFTRADGALGNTEANSPDGVTLPAHAAPQLAWTGATWSIVSGKARNTPSLGGELYDEPARIFTSGIYSWVVYVNNLIANDVNTLKITYVDTTAGAMEYLRDDRDLNTDLTIGAWYRLLVDTKVNVGGSTRFNVMAAQTCWYDETSSSFVTHPLTFRAATVADYLYLTQFGAGDVMWLDNLSLKSLTLSDLFSSLVSVDADILISTDIVIGAQGTQAGLVINLDSAASPANFLIVYHDGYWVRLDKCVAGVYTNLINNTSGYFTGKTLRVVTYHSGTDLKVRVYYNDALIGTEQTVSDVGIRDNTIHGMFSTYEGNTFDNFTILARGSDNEYAALDKWSAP